MANPRSSPLLPSLVLGIATLAFPARSEAAGPAAWAPLDPGTDQDLTDVHFADAENGWAVGAFSTVLRTRDAGASWESVDIPVSESFFATFALGADDAFVARNSLNRTTDGGESWGEDVDGFSTRGASIFDIEFVSPEVGFLVQSGKIYRTVDGGSNWEDVSEFDGLFLDAIQVADGDTLYATGGITYIDIFGSRTEGNMARSRDGGATWQAVPLDGVDEIHSAVWFDGLNGLLFTFSGAAFRTGDGGDTWETLTEEMVDTGGARVGIVTDALVANDGAIVGVTFDGAIIESEDGTVWNKLAEVGVPMSRLTKNTDGTMLAVGNEGRMWSRSPGQNQPPLPFRVAGVGFDRSRGKITIDAEGEACRGYRLEASLDLKSWEEVEVQTALEPTFQFEVDAPRDGAATYYRVVQLPAR